MTGLRVCLDGGRNSAAGVDTASGTSSTLRQMESLAAGIAERNRRPRTAWERSAWLQVLSQATGLRRGNFRAKWPPLASLPGAAWDPAGRWRRPSPIQIQNPSPILRPQAPPLRPARKSDRDPERTVEGWEAGPPPTRRDQSRLQSASPR